MFGHEKGAFTGAVAQRIGRFELANRGTVFLDEIGEIPLELQPKLLRVLQEREFERLGSSRTLRTDARLIAATNRDLGAMVEEQKFRADLFYRLNVFPVHVPPLRERQDDIPLLVRHFVQQFARRMGKAVDTIPTETMNVLVRYHWPGNIRELQNLVERAVILSTGPILKVPLNDLQAQPAPAAARKIETLEEAERRHILDALDASDWVISGPKGAAAIAGVEAEHPAGSHGKAGDSPGSRGGALPELAISGRPGRADPVRDRTVPPPHRTGDSRWTRSASLRGRPNFRIWSPPAAEKSPGRMNGARDRPGGFSHWPH